MQFPPLFAAAPSGVEGLRAWLQWHWRTPATAWEVVAGSVVAIALFELSRAIWARRASPVSPPPRVAPQRSHYGLLALLACAFTLYGSTVPFRLGSLAWNEALQQFKHVLAVPVVVSPRPDLVFNVLLGIPASFCLLGALELDRPWSWRSLLAGPLVVGVVSGLGVLVEFLQVWLPDRVPSQNDVAAQSVGALLGACSWRILGPSLTAKLRDARLRPRGRLQLALEIYLLGLIAYAVLPLDVITSPSELAAKYRNGQIELRPLAFSPPVQYLDLLKDALVFVPVGVLMAIRTGRRGVLAGLVQVGWGTLVPLAIEAAQVLIASRYSSTDDVLLGAVGVAVGVGLARWLPASSSEDAAESGVTLGASAYALATIVYSVVLVLVFCWPLRPTTDAGLARERFEHMLRVPMEALRSGSEFNFVTQVLRKTLFFVPWGLGAGLAIQKLRWRPWPRRALWALTFAVGAGLAVGIELLQVFLPPHVPDFTDSALCALGAVIGGFLSLGIDSAAGGTR